jgi:hypothetical protein
VVDRDDSVSELREAAHALTEAAQALRTQAQPAAAEPAQPAQPEAKPRDFAAELEALKERYEGGGLELAEYMEQRDDIREAKIVQRFEQDRAAREQEQAQQSQAQAQAAFAGAYTEFFSGAEAAINERLASPALKPGFDAITIDLVRQGRTYTDALAQAREQVFQQIGVALPSAANKAEAIAKATAARAPEGRPSPTLADMPAAAALSTGKTAELDNLPVEELEHRIARMNDKELEEYLADAEGGLRDHPRAGRN